MKVCYYCRTAEKIQELFTKSCKIGRLGTRVGLGTALLGIRGLVVVTYKTATT